MIVATTNQSSSLNESVSETSSVIVATENQSSSSSVVVATDNQSLSPLNRPESETAFATAAIVCSFDIGTINSDDIISPRDLENSVRFGPKSHVYSCKTHEKVTQKWRAKRAAILATPLLRRMFWACSLQCTPKRRTSK